MKDISCSEPELNPVRVLVTDFGGLRVKWGLFKGGELAERGVIDSSSVSSPEKFAGFLQRFEYDRFVLGFAGLVKDGIVIHAPNHPGWDGYNLRRVFGEDIIVENDARGHNRGERRQPLHPR